MWEDEPGECEAVCLVWLFFFFKITRRPRRPPLFPYPPLFQSRAFVPGAPYYGERGGGASLTARPIRVRPVDLKALVFSFSLEPQAAPAAARIASRARRVR